MFIFIACNDNNENPNPTSPQETLSDVTAPNYVMDIDTGETADTSFKFKPIYSGLYKLNYDNQNVNVTLNEEKVENGGVRYYDKKSEYKIKYAFESEGRNVAHGTLTPIELTDNQLEVKGNNDYIVKFVPEETGLFKIAASKGQVKVLDINYELVNSVESTDYFLEKNIKSEFYYIVAENQSYADISIHIDADKIIPDTIHAERNDKAVAKQLSGTAGERKYFLIDIKEEGEYVLAYHGISGNKDVKSKLYDSQSFSEINATELIVGNNECMYRYKNLKEGKYYLKIEFTEDIAVELYIK